jgi:hypothetical protein
MQATTIEFKTNKNWVQGITGVIKGFTEDEKSAKTERLAQKYESLD